MEQFEDGGPIGGSLPVEKVPDTSKASLPPQRPKLQIPANPDGYHCDINTWNQSINRGYNPTPPSGKQWDGNLLNVNNIAKLYPNKRKNPKEGTAGIAFVNNDGKSGFDHMFFYDNTDTDKNTYKAYDSNGIDPQMENIWSIYGSTVKNGYFVPLDVLKK